MNEKLLVLKFNTILDLNNISHISTFEFYNFIKLFKEEYNYDVYTLTDVERPNNDTFNYVLMDNYDNLLSLVNENFKKIVVVCGLMQNSKYNKILYNLINDFKGEIYFLITDILLLPTDNESLKLTNNNINLISTLFNDEEDMKIYLENTQGVFKNYKNISIYQFYLELYKNSLFKPKRCPSVKDKLDYCYFGGYRRGERNKKLKKYVFNEEVIKNLSIDIYGNITQEHVKEINDKIDPSSLSLKGYVDNSKITSKLCNYRTSILINDDNSKNRGYVFRIFEIIFSNCVILVDEESFDKDLLFSSKDLIDFSYIKDTTELIDKVLKLRDEKFYKHIVTLQRAEFLKKINSYKLRGMITKGNLN